MTSIRRVVVVDEDSQLGADLSVALDSAEFEVHSFVDPRDALLALRELGADLILSERTFSSMNGRTFLGLVSQSSALRDIPFLYVSAAGALEEVAATMESVGETSAVRSSIRILPGVHGGALRGARHGCHG